MPRLTFTDNDTGKTIIVEEDGTAHTPDGTIVPEVKNIKEAIQWTKNTNS